MLIWNQELSFRDSRQFIAIQTIYVKFLPFFFVYFYLFLFIFLFLQLEFQSENNHVINVGWIQIEKRIKMGNINKRGSLPTFWQCLMIQICSLHHVRLLHCLWFLPSFPSDAKVEADYQRLGLNHCKGHYYTSPFIKTSNGFPALTRQCIRIPAELSASVIAATCLGNSFKVHLAILLLTLCTLGGKKVGKEKKNRKWGKNQPFYLPTQ